jgi:hypothetical protein
MDKKRADEIVELSPTESEQVVGGTSPGPASNPDAANYHPGADVLRRHDDHSAKKI